MKEKPSLNELSELDSNLLKKALELSVKRERDSFNDKDSNYIKCKNAVEIINKTKFIKVEINDLLGNYDAYYFDIKSAEIEKSMNGWDIVLDCNQQMTVSHTDTEFSKKSLFYWNAMGRVTIKNHLLDEITSISKDQFELICHKYFDIHCLFINR